MNYTEESAFFACEGDALLGMLTLPVLPAKTGVIVMVGGPQYRVGSHRQFVLLARRLAQAGYAVLRFDYRGMGDSTGAPRSFETVSADIAAAVHFMRTHLPTVQNIALWGLCDGASAALLYFHETHDPLVRGLCLLNPWIRSEVSLARTQVKHYYTRRLMQKDFWMKLLSGNVARSALAGFFQRIRMSTGPQETTLFQERMAHAWRGFSGQIMLLLSGEDYVAKEFLDHVQGNAAWAHTLTNPQLTRHDFAGVDHTFSNAVARHQVEELTLQWLSRLDGATGTKARAE